MGTSGTMGVRLDGVDKVTYNHYDSYPSSLGNAILRDLRALLRDPGLAGLRELALGLRVVSLGGPPPTAEEQVRFARFCDTSISFQNPADWYCLLRELQGELAKSLHAQIMLEADEMHVMWNYLVNLDEERLEVTRPSGRRLRFSIPFAELDRYKSLEEWPELAAEEES